MLISRQISAVPSCQVAPRKLLEDYIEKKTRQNFDDFAGLTSTPKRCQKSSESFPMSDDHFSKLCSSPRIDRAGVSSPASQHDTKSHLGFHKRSASSPLLHPGRLGHHESALKCGSGVGASNGAAVPILQSPLLRLARQHCINQASARYSRAAKLAPRQHAHSFVNITALPSTPSPSLLRSQKIRDRKQRFKGSKKQPSLPTLHQENSTFDSMRMSSSINEIPSCLEDSSSSTSCEKLFSSHSYHANDSNDSDSLRRDYTRPLSAELPSRTFCRGFTPVSSISNSPVHIRGCNVPFVSTLPPIASSPLPPSSPIPPSSPLPLSSPRRAATDQPSYGSSLMPPPNQSLPFLSPPTASFLNSSLVPYVNPPTASPLDPPDAPFLDSPTESGEASFPIPTLEIVSDSILIPVSTSDVDGVVSSLGNDGYKHESLLNKSYVEENLDLTCVTNSVTGEGEPLAASSPVRNFSITSIILPSQFSKEGYIDPRPAYHAEESCLNSSVGSPELKCLESNRDSLSTSENFDITLATTCNTTSSPNNSSVYHKNVIMESANNCKPEIHVPASCKLASVISSSVSEENHTLCTLPESSCENSVSSSVSECVDAPISESLPKIVDSYKKNYKTIHRSSNNRTDVNLSEANLSETVKNVNISSNVVLNNAVNTTCCSNTSVACIGNTYSISRLEAASTVNTSVGITSGVSIPALKSSKRFNPDNCCASPAVSRRRPLSSDFTSSKSTNLDAAAKSNFRNSWSGGDDSSSNVTQLSVQWKTSSNTQANNATTSSIDARVNMKEKLANFQKRMDRISAFQKDLQPYEAPTSDADNTSEFLSLFSQSPRLPRAAKTSPLLAVTTSTISTVACSSFSYCGSSSVPSSTGNTLANNTSLQQTSSSTQLPVPSLLAYTSHTAHSRTSPYCNARLTSIPVSTFAYHSPAASPVLSRAATNIRTSPHFCYKRTARNAPALEAGSLPSESSMEPLPKIGLSSLRRDAAGNQKYKRDSKFDGELLQPGMCVSPRLSESKSSPSTLGCSVTSPRTSPSNLEARRNFSHLDTKSEHNIDMLSETSSQCANDRVGGTTCVVSSNCETSVVSSAKIHPQKDMYRTDPSNTTSSTDTTSPNQCVNTNIDILNKNNNNYSIHQ